MIALLACVAVFLAAYTLGRRSLVHGILVTLVSGYVYGIFRANFLTPFSHFLADSAVVGLFLAQLLRPMPEAERQRLSGVRAWLFLLVLWPVILFLVPVQDTLVQLVGLRGAVLVLGFLLLGARLTSAEWYQLAIWIAGLNLAAFALALIEFRLGIEPFFPQSAVTEIMYRSRIAASEEGGRILYRIPSSFSSAHAYGGTMVVTLPLLLGAWVAAGRTELRRLGQGWHRSLLLASIVASALGVFMSAARQHAIMLFVLIVSATMFGRLRTSYRVSWIVILLAVGVLENEYGRIMLEQGIPGLLMWIGFVAWVVVKGARAGIGEWAFARRLAWIIVSAYLLTAAIGLGLLASIPQSYLLFLLIGWVVVRPAGTRARAVATGARSDPRVLVAPGVTPPWAGPPLRPLGDS